MQKKIPQRQCMGCRERMDKGAYICPKAECLKKAQKSKALDRSLEVTIPQEVYDRLEREIEVQHG